MAKKTPVKSAAKKAAPKTKGHLILPSRSHAPVPYCIFVSSLAANDIKVARPIPVTIETESDESFIASFLDAGVSSGGNTVQDAVWSLQQMIASSFRMLEKMGNSELGPKMRREKAVLSEFLCRASQKHTQKIQQKS
jgi:hypothetical protein